MNQLRSDFNKRLQYETTLMKPGMGHRQEFIVQYYISVEEKIKVHCPGSPPDLSGSLENHCFNLLEPHVKIFRRQSGFELQDSVEKGLLKYPSHRFGVVKSRQRGDPAFRKPPHLCDSPEEIQFPVALI